MPHLGILAHSIAIDLEPQKLQWCIRSWQNYRIGTDFDLEVSRHKLWPTLEFCCRQNKLWEHLPPDLQARLQAARQHYALRQLQSISQLEELDAALTEQGLTGILLKGSALFFHQIYPSLGDRATADIDLAVAPDQIPAFLEVLRSLNYTSDYPILPEITAQTHHLLPFKRSDSLQIDVHPLAPFDGIIQQFSDEMAATAEHPEGFTALQVPTPTELFWHMAWHTHFNLSQLRNILDLYRLQHLHRVDLALLSQRAQRYHLQGHWARLLDQVKEIVAGKPTLSTIHRWEWYPKLRLGYCRFLPDRTNWQTLRLLLMKSTTFPQPFLYPGIVMVRSIVMGLTYLEWFICRTTFLAGSTLRSLKT